MKFITGPHVALTGIMAFGFILVVLKTRYEMDRMRSDLFQDGRAEVRFDWQSDLIEFGGTVQRGPSEPETEFRERAIGDFEFFLTKVPPCPKSN